MAIPIVINTIKIVYKSWPHTIYSKYEIVCQTWVKDCPTHSQIDFRYFMSIIICLMYSKFMQTKF